MKRTLVKHISRPSIIILCRAAIKSSLYFLGKKNIIVFIEMLTHLLYVIYCSITPDSGLKKKG